MAHELLQGEHLRQVFMAKEEDQNGVQTVAIDPWPIGVLKRTLLVLAGPFYFLFIAFVPLLCSHRRGFRGWYWRTVRRACSRLLWLLSIRTEMDAEHRQELAADTDSVIVINHRSHLDGFALMDALPEEKWLTFAAKKELCDAFLLRTGFKAAGLVEIDRSSGKVAMQTLHKAVSDMPRRRSVVLFPEGTRTKGDTLGSFKPGAVVVARETGRSIRPIVILDSDQLLPRGRVTPSSGTIRIVVLPPFHCDPNASVEADVARLREQMRSVFHGA